MVAFIYKLISEDEEERFIDIPIKVNVQIISSQKNQISQVIEGVRSINRSVTLISYQSRLNDLLEEVEIGDKLDLEDKEYIIKSIDKYYMNFQSKGRRKYLITL